MSAIATLLKSQGNFVCGYDLSLNNQVKQLRERRIEIIDNTDNFDLLNQCDIVCYSHAIKKDNPLLVQAIKQNKCVLTREKMLQIISHNYKDVVAISGCHGKSSTTGLISYILNECGKNPTMHLGAELSQYNTNVLFGDSKLFITEACEYKKSFLTLTPNISVILNIEFDHVDCYSSIDDLINVFNQFKKQTLNMCIVNGDCNNCKTIVDSNTITFGLSKTNDCYAENIERNIDYYSFTIVFCGKKIRNVKTKLIGEHNISNILASYIVLNKLGVPDKEFKDNLLNYNGIKRRLEKIKTINDCPIIIDYAHHPTEIKSTIKLLKEFTTGKVHCVFQPHTFSRTEIFMNEFCESLSPSDYIYLTPIYPARELPIEGVSSEILYEKISTNGYNVEYIEKKENVPAIIKSRIKPGDCVIILGAGDINEISELF